MAANSELLAERKRYDPVEMSIAVVSGLALAFTALFLCVVPLTASFTGSRDFVVFWATGQQLVHHGDPYDAGCWIYCFAATRCTVLLPPATRLFCHLLYSNPARQYS